MKRMTNMGRWLFACLLVIALAGCGESGIGAGGGIGTGAAGGANDGSPTLGITSIQKAVPPPKPTQAKGWIDRGFGFLFGSPVMAQSAADCTPPDFKHTVPLSDGKIWITQAYLILDEIEFQVPNQPEADGPEIGPFAFDLTNTDGNVPQEIRPDVPPGNYSGMKFAIKRVDEFPAEQPINLGDHLSAFIKKIFDDTTKRRPSIWIEGVMQVMQVDNPAPCNSFKFVTDQEWRVTFPFRTGVTIDPNRLDVVLFLDLPQAFKTAGVTVAQLTDEIGKPSSDKPLGAGFLDGRMSDPAWGTVNARKVAAQLPKGLKLFEMAAGTFVTDPGVNTETDERISDDSGPQF